MLYVAAPGYTALAARALITAQRISRFLSLLFHKPAYAAFILLLILGEAIVGSPGRAESGSIRATARVVDVRWDRAATELARPALPDSIPLERATAAQLLEWARTVEGERVIDGATVRIEFSPATADEPAVIRVAWTSN